MKQHPVILRTNTHHSVVLCLVLAHSVFGATSSSFAQQIQPSTERSGLGYAGPVRSVLTTVTSLNPDPRPGVQRKLIAQGMPDWVAFDTDGRRVEFASAVNRDGFEAISQCTFKNDGTKVCTDSTGHQQESRKQETTLDDGSHQVTYFRGSEIESRELTRFDEEGRAVGFRSYDGHRRLRSEQSIMLNGDDEWKIYDESGHVAQDEQTRISDDKTRFDRWSYDSEGHLVWHIALNGDGEPLSDWYNVGYKPKVSSSDSLGICRPRLCVSYKFDEQGSGRMEKMVQRTSGGGNLEPDSEEHYNFDGILDEKVEIKYIRDSRGNWISRSVFVLDLISNEMIEVERDSRTIDYY